MKNPTTKTEGVLLGYRITRRRLTIAIALTCLLYLAGYYLAQNWTLSNFALSQLKFKPARPFRIQTQEPKTKSAQQVALTEATAPASPSFQSFTPPTTVSTPPPPAPSQQPVTFNENTTPPSQLPSSDLATRTVPSLSQTISPAAETDPNLFNLPSALPSRAAEETLPTSPEPSGNGIGAGLGNSSGFSDVGQLLNADLSDQLASPEGVVVRLSNEVLFDFDSYQLRATAASILSQVAALIEKYPQAQISIEGHADTFGDDAYNLTLSEQRAQTVHDFLRQNSSLATPVQVIGYGEQNPLANPQGSIKEQQLNRRVEIRLKTVTSNR